MADGHGGIKLTQCLPRIGRTRTLDILIGPCAAKRPAVAWLHRDARGGIRDAAGRRLSFGRGQLRFGRRRGGGAASYAEREDPSDQQQLCPHDSHLTNHPRTQTWHLQANSRRGTPTAARRAEPAKETPLTP